MQAKLVKFRGLQIADEVIEYRDIFLQRLSPVAAHC